MAENHSVTLNNPHTATGVDYPGAGTSLDVTLAKCSREHLLSWKVLDSVGSDHASTTYQNPRAASKDEADKEAKRPENRLECFSRGLQKGTGCRQRSLPLSLSTPGSHSQSGEEEHTFHHQEEQQTVVEQRMRGGQGPLPIISHGAKVTARQQGSEGPP